MIDGFAFTLGVLAALATVAAVAAVARIVWLRIRYRRLGWWLWRLAAKAVGTTRRPS